MHTKRPRQFWEAAIRELIKRRLKSHNLTYAELAKRITKAGGKESQTSITNKLSRGTFRASFFVMVLGVLDEERVSVAEIAALGYRLEKQRKKRAGGPGAGTIKKPILRGHYRFDENGEIVSSSEISAETKKRIEGYFRPRR